MEDTKHYFELKGKNAEKIVHDLAEKTFLVDWCFPNPKLQNNKELCDLLVVFDDIAIIWQIKDLKLDKNGKYKKAEVDKNLRQLSGADRQMFKLKSKIELSNARRKKENFDPNSITEVFLISVLLGKGENYHSALEEIKGHNVHVFTKEFTEIALNELDTISDFCAYLRAKEQFFRDKPKSIIVTGGEQEILAIYLREGRSFGQYKKADNIYLDGTLWDGLLTEPRFIKKKDADKISYGWDSIINRAHTGSSRYELVARELARPNRFERRYLSKVFMEAHVMAHKDNVGDLFRRMMAIDGVTYCFLFADDFEKPRTRRQAMLASICYLARGKFPQNKKVIGVATEKKFRSISSYDFVLIDRPDWTEGDQKKIEKLQKETGMFVNPVINERHEDEYPE
ncbi:MAG: hypothetical protein HN981_02465 [Candidatus Pacebacteria bacterium]|jgi:hypothetical protein|nr:hypothetical protein [Candidatus Paceibacterota bacterium]MBT6921233.1 hypothetical protein [Candidatus Paceibacterota bacterium]